MLKLEVLEREHGIYGLYDLLSLVLDTYQELGEAIECPWKWMTTTMRFLWNLSGVVGLSPIWLVALMMDLLQEPLLVIMDNDILSTITILVMGTVPGGLIAWIFYGSEHIAAGVFLNSFIVTVLGMAYVVIGLLWCAIMAICAIIKKLMHRKETK